MQIPIPNQQCTSLNQYRGPVVAGAGLGRHSLLRKARVVSTEYWQQESFSFSHIGNWTFMALGTFICFVHWSGWMTYFMLSLQWCFKLVLSRAMKMSSVNRKETCVEMTTLTPMPWKRTRRFLVPSSWHLFLHCCRSSSAREEKMGTEILEKKRQNSENKKLKKAKSKE